MTSPPTLGPLRPLRRSTLRNGSTTSAVRALIVASALAVVGATVFIPASAAQDAPAETPAAETPAAAAPADEAEQPISWSVAPDLGKDGADRPNFVLDATPGETLHDSLVVTNSSEVNLVLGVYASDAFNTTDGKIDLLAGDQKPTDVGAWTTADSPSVTVPAGGRVIVPFTVAVPPDASSGDHVGGIVTSLVMTEQDAEGNQVRVERRLGTRIYLRVTGELTPELSFDRLTATHTQNWNPFRGGTVEVSYKVTNTGNTRLRAKQAVTVQSGLGTDIRRADGEDMAELLPGNSYELTQTVDGVWPFFATKVSVELSPYDSSLRQDVAPEQVVGNYRLSLFPAPQLVGLLVLALIGLGVVVARRRRRKAMATAIQTAVSEAVSEAIARTPAAHPAPAPAPGEAPPPAGFSDRSDSEWANAQPPEWNPPTASPTDEPA